MNYKFVKELMTSPAITCDSNSSIKETIQLMKQYNIGFIPITKNNVMVGVITDRDILIRGLGIHDLDIQIETIMTGGEIHFTSPNSLLIDAAKIMANNKIRRLVVLNDGKVEGVLTTKNMLKEPSLIPYIIDTYIKNKTLNEYSMYMNSNPHDSVKTDDYPL